MSAPQSASTVSDPSQYHGRKGEQDEEEETSLHPLVSALEHFYCGK